MSAFNQIERTPHQSRGYRKGSSTMRAITENFVTPILIISFFSWVILTGVGVI